MTTQTKLAVDVFYPELVHVDAGGDDFFGRLWGAASLIPSRSLQKSNKFDEGIYEDVLYYGGMERGKENFVTMLRCIRIHRNLRKDNKPRFKVEVLVPTEKNAEVTKIVAGHRACTIGHKFFVFGGVGSHYQDYMNDLIIYDIDTQSWSSEVGVDAITAREGHSMTPSPNEKKIFLFAGADADTCQQDLYEYDVEEKTVKPIACTGVEHAPTNRFYHSAVVVPQTEEGQKKNYLYIMGGMKSAERSVVEHIYRYNIDEQTFEQPLHVASTSAQVYSAGLSEHESHRIGKYIVTFGGRTNNLQPSDQNTLSLFNLEGQYFENKERFSYEVKQQPPKKTQNVLPNRAGHCVVRISPDELLVIGGDKNCGKRKDIFIIKLPICDVNAMSMLRRFDKYMFEKLRSYISHNKKEHSDCLFVF